MTKLHIPAPRPGLVPRPRLIERLNAGVCHAPGVTLISAPAGYGKTTLLSEWAQTEKRLAWLSLDEKDNDPVRFWMYVLAALETVGAELVEQAQVILGSRGIEDERIELALTALCNALAEQATPLILVLDDYHAIETPQIHSTLAFLLDHLPPQAHLFIASRADPPLSLSQWRARGQMVELRAADLRFRPEEVAAFLKRVVDLPLTPQEIAALETRTEGWIAGLQLAALALQALAKQSPALPGMFSMQGHDDVSGFIAAFTGSNRYILDYLAEQVLSRHPPQVQDFLLQTCILDRLCAPLCDAVLGYESSLPQELSSQAMLEMLEQVNLFTIPLDQERCWYRYHHLFADFLQSRLRLKHPNRELELHRRAASWLEQNGLLAEAIDHALAAQDYAGAGCLVEQVAETILMRGEAHTLLGWLDTLPDALVHSRPRLCASHALAMIILGQLDVIEPHLLDAEKSLTVDDNSVEAAEVRSQIAGLRAMLAAYRGDVPRLVELAHQASGHLVTENPFLSGMVAWLVGLAYYLDDNAEAARVAFVRSHQISQVAGNMFAAVLSLHLLTTLHIARGQLRQARQAFQQGLQFKGVGLDLHSFPIACLTYFGAGEVLREQNELEAAERYLREGLEIGKMLAGSDWLLDGYLSLAQVKLASGDTDTASNLIQEARRSLSEKAFVWHLVQVEALQVRTWIAQGRLSLATEWAARQAQLAPGRRQMEQVPLQIRAIVYPTLAQLWIAQREFERALDLLEPLRQEAEAGGWMGIVIKILALQALALYGSGKRDQSLAKLDRALALAEPEGYVRIFVDEGEPMRFVISDFRFWIDKHSRDQDHALTSYVDRLLAAFAQPGAVLQSKTLALAPRGAARRARAGVSMLRVKSKMFEPLSKREMEILDLMANGFSNQEIAQQLIIGMSTVKTHINHIFGKLGADSRRQAVACARELNLI